MRGSMWLEQGALAGCRKRKNPTLKVIYISYSILCNLYTKSYHMWWDWPASRETVCTILTIYLRDIHFDRKISFTTEWSRATICLQLDHWQKVIPTRCYSYAIPNSTNAFLFHCSLTKWDYNTVALKWFSRNNIHLKEVGVKHCPQWEEMNFPVIFWFYKYLLAAKTMWLQKVLSLLINVNTF